MGNNSKSVESRMSLKVSNKDQKEKSLETDWSIRLSAVPGPRSSAGRSYWWV